MRCKAKPLVCTDCQSAVQHCGKHRAAIHITDTKYNSWYLLGEQKVHVLISQKLLLCGTTNILDIFVCYVRTNIYNNSQVILPNEYEYVIQHSIYLYRVSVWLNTFLCIAPLFTLNNWNEKKIPVAISIACPS